ncbi:MAG TPA: alpha/beta hydrolase [Armatimonadota bacterium]|jgi:acetyl esterase/lipase
MTDEFGHEIIRLWEDPAPLATGDAAGDIPTLTVFLPPAELATGQAVVVCPGGGYGGLACDHEGYQIGAWLNERGIAAFMLRYRVAPYRHPAPLLDAQRAVRTVRARAAEWGVDPARIGIWGFSAGGHLVATVGTQPGACDPAATDPVDRVSARPDFLILCYPVISLTAPYSHFGSRDNLLGVPANPALSAALSAETQVTADTPPTFLFHTDADEGVPAENSVAFYLALRQAGVPAELHIYRPGGHGVGLAQSDEVLCTWPERLADWLRGLA